MVKALAWSPYLFKIHRQTKGLRRNFASISFQFCKTDLKNKAYLIRCLRLAVSVKSNYFWPIRCPCYGSLSISHKSVDKETKFN